MVNLNVTLSQASWIACALEYYYNDLSDDGDILTKKQAAEILDTLTYVDDIVKKHWQPQERK